MGVSIKNIKKFFGFGTIPNVIESESESKSESKYVTKSESESEIKWIYMISVNNVPDNDLTNIKSSHLKSGYIKDITIPRIGEKICCCNENDILFYGVVSEVFHNYAHKLVFITFNCTEVKKKNI